jgi:adenylylsulfate kinase-like enzyme
MTQRILIMGLPGSGKTFLATALKTYIETHSNFYNVPAESLYGRRATVAWFNADDVRKRYNDWDFSAEGRIRQSHRMRELADATEMIVKPFIYWCHERVWSRVNWGRAK